MKINDAATLLGCVMDLKRLFWESATNKKCRDGIENSIPAFFIPIRFARSLFKSIPAGSEVAAVFHQTPGKCLALALQTIKELHKDLKTDLDNVDLQILRLSFTT